MATKKTTKKKTSKREEKQFNTWTDKISEVDSPSRNYSIRETYELNDLIDHPTFGAGVVVNLQGEEKIEVTFSDTTRWLVHNK